MRVVKGGSLQRLFSTFPSGRPGIGLLLLRFALGGAAILQALTMIAAEPGDGTLRFWAALVLAAGVLLTLGFLTPLAAGSLTLLYGSVAAGWIAAEGSPPFGVTVLSAIVSAAVMLLGPGAFAVDAKLFGRREIRIGRGRGTSPR